MKPVEGVGLILCQAEQVVPQVDVGQAAFVAECFERSIGFFFYFQGADAVGTGQDALDINLCRGRYLLQVFHHKLGILQHVCGIVDAVGAEVVGTDHHEHLGRFACSHGVDVGQCFVGHGARYTTVHHVGVAAEGLPPLVHIGDAVADEHDALVVGRKHLERIISVIAEGQVGLEHRQAQQEATQKQ